MSRENENGMENKANFKFPEENQEQEKANKIEAIEANQEIKLEALEIRSEDIKGIEGAMETERNKKGISGKQRLAFEGSGLAGLRKEAPEVNIKKVEFSGEDAEKCRERMEKDIEEAVEAKTNAVQKEWEKEKRKAGRIQTDENTPEEEMKLRERINEKIKSEQVWIREFQSSYLKDILDKEAFEKSGFEITDEKWKDTVDDLRRLIDKEDWHNVIPRMGHMNNLNPEKFDEVRSLFNTIDRDRMLHHIDELRGNEAIGKKTNAWELGSRIRYAAECFPELRSRIELDYKNWKKMNTFLEDARKEGNYWAVSYHGRNMKFIENMAKRGEINIMQAESDESKTAVE